MKKIISCLMLLVMLTLTLSSCEVFANYKNSRQLFYGKADADDCLVYGRNDASGDIIIPREHNRRSVVGIGDKAFYSRRKITSVVIPDTVKSIGDYAFYDCASLRSVDIPSSLNKIGVGAFSSCISLESVNIPSVKMISEKAFAHCRSIEIIVIPDGVEFIDDYAFASCGKLENAIIGRGVKYIGCNVFLECDSLKAITYTGTVEEWNLIYIDSLGIDNIVVKCNDGVVNL